MHGTTRFLATVAAACCSSMLAIARTSNGPVFHDEVIAAREADAGSPPASAFALLHDEKYPTLGPTGLRDPFVFDDVEREERIHAAFTTVTNEAAVRRDGFDGRIRGLELRLLLERVLNPDGVPISPEETATMNAAITTFLTRQGLLRSGIPEADHAHVDESFLLAWGTTHFLRDVGPQLSAARAAAVAASHAAAASQPKTMSVDVQGAGVQDALAASGIMDVMTDSDAQAILEAQEQAWQAAQPGGSARVLTSAANVEAQAETTAAPAAGSVQAPADAASAMDATAVLEALQKEWMAAQASSVERAAAAAVLDTVAGTPDADAASADSVTTTTAADTSLGSDADSTEAAGA